MTARSPTWCAGSRRRRRDERGEAGRCGLHDPAPGLDGPQPARGDLLGLHDRAGVARPVRRVEDQPRRRRCTPSRARPPKNTSHEITTARTRVSVPSPGSVETAGPVPATASRRTGQRARRALRAARAAARTRRTAPGGPCRSGSTISPSGADHDLGVDELLGRPATSSVTPTAIGAPSRRGLGARSTRRARRWPRRSTTSIVFSGQTTRSRPGSGSIDRGGVEVTFGHESAGHLEGAGALLAAALHGGDAHVLAGVVATRGDERMAVTASGARAATRAVRPGRPARATRRGLDAGRRGRSRAGTPPT